MPRTTGPRLAKLTPRERETFKALYTPGSTTTVEELAERFGVCRHVVVSYVGKCRLKLGKRFVPALPNPQKVRGAVRKGKETETVAAYVPGYGRLSRLPHDDQETPLAAKQRVAREIAGGTRCGKCWLLKPCACAVAQTFEPRERRAA